MPIKIGAPPCPARRQERFAAHQQGRWLSARSRALAASRLAFSGEASGNKQAASDIRFCDRSRKLKASAHP